MLDRKHFQRDSQLIIEWIDGYFKNIEQYPVKSGVKPGDIKEKIPPKMPEAGEGITEIMQDFQEVILPGISHWQHPNFHAFFNANSSTESVLAEMLTAALGAQCMIWETSPAAAELEERMMDWFKQAFGLPQEWQGVIQDTASTATLSALITAREVATGFTSNELGVPNNLRIYCSTETHSSIEKAAGIAGIGRSNVVKIDTDQDRKISATSLENAIKADLIDQKKPCAVVLTLGSTGVMAIDDIETIAPICKKYGLWLHVDAAYAGSALILPEYQWMIRGAQEVDSFVFNPHKWLFTNFDCSVYFVRDADLLIRSFEILPEYLKNRTRGQVNDYRDWGIQLGRRFRALKLWFVLRSYGLRGLQEKLRHHINLTQQFVEWVKEHPDLELVTQPVLNFCCFRYHPVGETLSLEELNTINEQLLNRINESGKAYLSHTKVEDQYALRLIVGQTYVEQVDVDRLINLIASFIIHE